MASLVVSVLAESAASGPKPVDVLLIGDSLSVGGFGDGMQESLVRKFGKENVCLFASCGSSPENWTKGGFVTRCGYRQTTPSGAILLEYRDGKRPPEVKTPKLRSVLAHYRPACVIVQLGTNWMDALAATTQPDVARYRGYVADFIRELRRGNPAVKVFWVLPPASSKYPSRVHEQVERWINETSREQGFFTINSRSITRAYREGKSGGDGVHYNDAAGRAWARGVYAKFLAGWKALALAPASPGS